MQNSPRETFDTDLENEPKNTRLRYWDSKLAALLSVFILCTPSWFLFGCAPATSMRTPFGAPSQLDTDVRSAPRGVFSASTDQQSEAIYSYLLGEIALQKQDQESAIKHLSKAKQLFDEPTPTIEGTLAGLYLSEGKTSEAVAAVHDALQADPDNEEFLLLHASLLHALGKTAEARTAYESYISANPNGFNGLLLCGVLELLDTTSENHFSQALIRLDAALALQPQNSLALFLRARALEGLGRLAEAQTTLEEVLVQEPKNPAAFVDLVRVLAQQGETKNIRKRTEQMVAEDPEHQAARRVLLYLSLEDRAGEDPIQRLATLAPSHLSVADVRFRLALGALRSQNQSAALRELRLVLVEEPTNADARYNIAAILSSSGDISGAVVELERIPKDSPLFSKARTFAAFLLRQIKQYERAEIGLREALSTDPTDSSMRSFLVILLREGGKPGAAKAIVEEQLRVDPQNERLLFSYGTLLHELGEEAQALEAMEKVLTLNAENGDALNFVAFSLADSRTDLDRAEKLITRALRIRPNDGYFLDTLGWIHFQRGDFSTAEEVLRIAVQTTSDDPEILEHYGDVLSQLEKRSEALKVYQSALEKIQDSGGTESEKTQERVREKILLLSGN